jgi:hypothetical protein
VSFNARTLSMYNAEYLGAVRDRLYAKGVEQPNGCKTFTGYLDGQGYGRLSVNGVVLRAHVVAYMLDLGDIPEDTDVGHTCNAQACFSLDHLYLASRSENVQHAVRDGLSRHWGRKPRVTDSQVKEICEKWAAGSMTQQALADLFCIDQQMVHRIVKNKAFRWVARA